MKLFAFIIIGLILSACQANKPASDNKGNIHHGIIKGNKNQLVEICPELTAGQTLSFEIKSNFPVLFNLHYHQADQAYYPIAERNLTSINQQYKALSSNTYCLMWTVHLDNTKTKYQYQIL